MTQKVSKQNPKNGSPKKNDSKSVKTKPQKWVAKKGMTQKVSEKSHKKWVAKKGTT